MQGKFSRVLTKTGLLVGLLGLVAPLGAQADPAPQNLVRTRVVSVPLRGTTNAAPEPIELTGVLTEEVTTDTTAQGGTVHVTSTLASTVGRGVNTGAFYILTGRDSTFQQVPQQPIRLDIVPTFQAFGRGVQGAPSKPVDVGVTLNASAQGSIDSITANVGGVNARPTTAR